MGIAEAHDEKLDREALTGDDDLGLAPVDLGVLAGLELQRQEGLGTLAALLELADVGTEARLTADVALGGEQLVDLASRIALLAGLGSLLVEQGQDALAKGIELGLRARARLGIAGRGGRGDSLAHALTRDAQVAGDLPDALILVVVSVSDGRVLIHRQHLYLCFPPGETGWMVAEERGLVNFSAITPRGGGQLLGLAKTTMSPAPHQNATRLVVRLHALLDALRHGPQELGELLARIGPAYPAGASARRMIDRDLAHLAALGIIVERGSNPTTYTLRGELLVFALDGRSIAELPVADLLP